MYAHPAVNWIVYLLLFLVVSVSALEEIIAASPTTNLEPRKVAPWSPSCTFFRLAAHHKDSVHARRRLGFLTFEPDRNSFLTRDPMAAAKFSLHSDGTMKSKGYFIGSRKRSLGRGWGPLKRHRHRPVRDETWSIKDSTDIAHFKHDDFTFMRHGGAGFCLETGIERDSVVYAQYTHAVPANYKCKPIVLKAQCVDHTGPNPSDDASIDNIPRSHLDEIWHPTPSEVQW